MLVKKVIRQTELAFFVHHFSLKLRETIEKRFASCKIKMSQHHLFAICLGVKNRIPHIAVPNLPVPEFRNVQQVILPFQ